MQGGGKGQCELGKRAITAMVDITARKPRVISEGEEVRNDKDVSIIEKS